MHVKDYLNNTYSRGVCAILCLVLSISNAYSQKKLGDLKADGNQHTIPYLDEQYQDATIPYNVSKGYLFLRAYGADGGYKKMNSSIKSDKKIDGGKGALVEAYFKIGNEMGEIPPGSTIRFIVGRRGESVSSGINSGAGGGGGTGIAYLKAKSLSSGAPQGIFNGGIPINELNPQWKILMIAGGGGGGRGDCCTSGDSGDPGRAYVPDLVLDSELKYYSMFGCPRGDKDSKTANQYGGSLFSCDSLTDGQTYKVLGSEKDVKFSHAGWPHGPFSEEPTGAWPRHETDWTRGGWGIGPGGEGRDAEKIGGGGGGYYGGSRGITGHAKGGASYVFGYVTAEKIENMVKEYDLEEEIEAYASEKMPGKMPGKMQNQTDISTLIKSLMEANALNVTGVFSAERGRTDGPTDGSVVYQFVDEVPSSNLIRSAFDQGKCVSVKNDQTGNKTDIMLSNCSGSDGQQWRFMNHTIVSELDYKKCLDLDQNKNDNGTNIQLYDCNSSNAQRWVYDGVGKQVRYLQNWKKCLDPESMNNGTIRLWDCRDRPYQQWKIDGAITAEGDTRMKTIHLAKDDSKCINLDGANTDNNTSNIHLYDCTGYGAQKWLFDGINIRYYVQQNKCVDLASNKTDNGTNIRLWDCNGSEAQHWVYDGMTSTIRYWKNPDKCLVVKGGSTAQGTNIEIQDCNGNEDQRWGLKDADTPFGPDKTKTITRLTDPNKCLDAEGGGTDNGTNIELWNCLGNTNQQWTYDGLYLTYKKDPTKCLDLKGADTHKGTNIELYSCNGSKAQRWLYDASGKAFRYADNWNRCLDLDQNNNNEGTNIQIYDCNGTDAQKWIMK